MDRWMVGSGGCGEGRVTSGERFEAGKRVPCSLRSL